MTDAQPDAARTDRILFASYVEPDLVERVRQTVPDIELLYRPDLLRPPRYPADHGGAERARSPEQEAEWRGLLREATILYDFDRTHLDDLPELAPNVHWIQATSAGIGQLVGRQAYADRMPDTIFTTARGVHAIPLAEFTAMSMLMHSRRAGHFRVLQSNKEWERYAATDLEGRTAVVVGLGAVGREVARVAQALRLRVVGIRRNTDSDETLPVDELAGPDQLMTHLPDADFLILVAPHTAETEGMIGAEQFAALPPGAALINIGRGALVDEAALVASLTSGHLAAAYLDVFAEEPLPISSPLWEMPNVLITPHSASTSDRENGRIIDIFCENLRRYLAGEERLNVLDTVLLY